MDAVVSGRAGVAILLDNGSLMSFDVDDPSTLLPRRQSDVRLLFGEANDLQFLENINHESAAQELERAFNRASALDLALILLDCELSTGVRKDAADELERLLSDPQFLKYLENVLYGRPLPAAADITGAQEHCGNNRNPNVLAMLQILEAYQPAIREVCHAWDALPAHLFGGKDGKIEFRNVAIGAGLFRELASEVASKRHAERLLLKSLLNPAFTALRNYREIVQQWMKPFRQATTTRNIKHEVVEQVWHESDARKGRRGRRRSINREVVLGNVQSQKALIIEALRRYDLNRARRIIDELVAYQLENGESIFAVKSLCDLAVEAKNLGINSLQIELTKRGIDILPSDAWTWAQYGDALLNGQRLIEALKAYDQALDFGAGAVAKRGRAETLRALGRLPEALAAYDEVMAEYPEDVITKSGRADTLRALGQLLEALAAYDEVMAEHPESVYAKTGRAETLRALGRLPEALAAYDDAIAAHLGNVVAKNGRAETLRALGRLPEALAAYDEVMIEHPEDVVTKSGRAETLRALGRLSEALIAYDDAVAVHPEDVVAKTGRAETLRALGRLPEALAAYDEVMIEHPKDTFAKNGRAETLRALGQLPEALAAYNEVMIEHPEDEVARNGRSCILVALHRYDEALKHLSNENPATLQEWIGYHIRGMIFLRTGEIEEAVKVFQRGVSENPWPAQREYFRTALAVAYLRRRNFIEAGRVLEEVKAPLLQPQANVLRLHSFGASGNTERAITAYQNLANKPWYISDEIVEELHRRHILKEEPRYSDDWIFEQEDSVNLLVANQQSSTSSSFSSYY